MRIGLTLYGSLANRSGGFRYDRRLVEELRRSGDSVDVIELPWRAYHRGLLDNLSTGIAARLDADIDVMLQDELAHPSLLRVNRHLPYPIVSIVHHLRASEPRRLSPLYRAVERRYLATVDGVVCNSTVTENVVTALGVDSDSTVVAPPAGDRFDPEIDAREIDARAANRPLQIVFVGNIDRRKGLDTLIDGLGDAEIDAELTIVGRFGEQQYMDEIRQRIDTHGLHDVVTITGALSDTDLAATLRDSHVLAVPSRYEGFGIVYLEGMSFGLPALASAAGGATDIVEDGETGRLVAPNDRAAVAEALTEFAEADRLAEMGRSARQRYEDHPGWQTTTARVRSLLTDIVGSVEATP